MAGEFGNGRHETSRLYEKTGEIVSWANTRMTRGIRALEDHAQEIVEAGKEAVQADIESSGRISDVHDSRDGYESMYEGVRTSVNASRTEGEVSMRVGWDLTEYRHGYPELQDKGFEHIGGTKVIGMQALTQGKLVMRELALKAIREGMRRDN